MSYLNPEGIRLHDHVFLIALGTSVEIDQSHFSAPPPDLARAAVTGRARELVNELNDMGMRNIISLSQRGYTTREIVDTLEVVCSDQTQALREELDPA